MKPLQPAPLLNFIVRQLIARLFCGVWANRSDSVVSLGRRVVREQTAGLLGGVTVKRMTDNEILAWLEADEAKSRPFRVQRMRLLLDRLGQSSYMLFFGGVVPAQAFEEMRLAYLNGLYVSCVVVSQIIIEHILAGLFEMANRTELEGAAFQKLTEEALADGYISQEEFDGLDQLRRLRNPYTHSKPIMHQSCFIRRAVETGNNPAELFKQDAETALTVVSRLLSRYPFSLPDETGSD